MLRLALLVVMLAACSSSAAARPAWPRATPHEVDGGESLAPRAAARAIAAILEEDKPAVRDTDVTAPAAAADAPTTSAPAAAPASDDPIITEEIVIEVED